jgi:AAA family ATP:ADP antiporter
MKLRDADYTKWSFLLLFSVALCHFIQKPFRDDVVTQIGLNNLNLLMSGSFVASIALAYIFYRFINIKSLLTIVLICNSLFLLYQFSIQVHSRNASIIYFIFTSAGNLSIISMASGKIMESIPQNINPNKLTSIYTAPTLAAIIGPLFCLLVTKPFNQYVLLLASVISLIGVVLSVLLEKSSNTIKVKQEHWQLGGRKIMPQLIVYTFLYTVVCTFFYYLLLSGIADSFRGEYRMKAFALAELASNLLGITTAWMVQGFTGRTKTWILLPVISLVILSFLGTSQIASLSIAFIILFRIFKNGIRTQARDLALLQVAPTAFIPLKNMVDTVVYRSGDMAGGWFLHWLDGSQQTIVLVCIPVVLLWLYIGSRLQINQTTNLENI